MFKYFKFGYGLVSKLVLSKCLTVKLSTDYDGIPFIINIPWRVEKIVVSSIVSETIEGVYAGWLFV